jgi:hypothetical protein
MIPYPHRRLILELLDHANAALVAADPADTPHCLATLWRGVCVAGAAGNILAICSDNPDYPVLFRNAEPVLAAAIRALRAAPSLPAGLVTEVNPAGGHEDRLDEQQATTLHAGILAIAMSLNTLGPQAAQHARGSDAQECREATMLASELHDAYTGRLRSFLNQSRTSFGPGSFVVRNRGGGHSHRKPPWRS